MLEISAVIIAGGASLALGWSLFVPGDRTRAVALRDEGRRLVTVVIGLMVMFLAAGTIEGFITGTDIPIGLRVAIGAVGWLAFVLYFVVRGRAAAARGITGGWGEMERVLAEEERTARRDPTVTAALSPSP
jgi:hypothetical protein